MAGNGWGSIRHFIIIIIKYNENNKSIKIDMSELYIVFGDEVNGWERVFHKYYFKCLFINAYLSIPDSIYRVSMIPNFKEISEGENK